MTLLRINAFLKHSKSLLFPNRLINYPIKLVIGNQSGDLDSIISSICFAYFDYIYKNDKLTKDLIIPVLSFSANDLKLRKDVLFMLNKLSISAENICFIDEFEIFSNEQFELTLVDHNLPEIGLKKFINNSKVTGIIDHHVDNKRFIDCEPRIIKMVGSCSTLISKYWFKKLKTIDSNNELIEKNVESLRKSFDLDELIIFIISPLLIDTTNLTHKITNEDLIIFKIYSNLINPTLINFDKHFEKLKKFKDNIDDLTIQDILKKDFKNYQINQTKFGIASMIKSINWLIDRDNLDVLIKEMKRFSKFNNLNILIIMSNYTSENKQFSRQLAIQGPIELVKPLNEQLNGNHNLDLRILIEDDNNGELFQLFEQGNLKASRKQIAPIFEDIFKCFALK